MMILGTEPTGRSEIDSPIQEVPCQSHTSVTIDEYRLDRPRLYLVPEKQYVSWLTKIRRVARSLREGSKQSLRIVLQHKRPPEWRMGTLNETPAMQIVADFYLTNTTQEDLFILKTYFVRYTCNGWVPSSRPIEGHAFVKNHIVDGEGSEKYKIPPGSTYQGHAAWWMHPPIIREGETLTGRGCFVDQFDKEYWTPVIKWTYQ